MSQGCQTFLFRFFIFVSLSCALRQLQDNSLTTLPSGLFDGLSNLQLLYVQTDKVVICLKSVSVQLNWCLSFSKPRLFIVCLDYCSLGGLKGEVRAIGRFWVFDGNGLLGHQLIDSRWFEKNPPTESGWKRRSKNRRSTGISRGNDRDVPYKNSHEFLNSHENLMRFSWENDILMRIFQFSWESLTRFFAHENLIFLMRTESS